MWTADINVSSTRSYSDIKKDSAACYTQTMPCFLQSDDFFHGAYTQRYVKVGRIIVEGLARPKELQPEARRAKAR